MDRYSFEESASRSIEIQQQLPGGVHYNFQRRGNGNGEASTLPFRDGEGSRVWDHDGNEHLDLFCKFGAMIVGHGNDEYNQAIQDCLARVPAANQTGIEKAVCEKIIHHVPSAEMVRFGLSGTEMVQNAIRLARAYTGRNRVLRFKGHYHGNADNVMGGRPKKDDAPVATSYTGDSLGTEGRADDILERQSFLIPWNDADILEDTLTQYGDEIAIVMMEPGAINGGGVLPDPSFLQRARDLCTQHGVVLAFDEVITGFRVGLSGAQGHFGVTPDLTVMGKALAGGALPVSALAGKRDLMEMYADGRVVHAGTFNGYTLGLAAVNATLKILADDPDCYNRMGNVLSRITDVMQKAADDVGLPLVMQGFPQVQVYHVTEHPLTDPAKYDTTIEVYDDIVRKCCAEYGIQICPTSRMHANLALGEDDVEFFSDRIWDALRTAKSIIG